MPGSCTEYYMCVQQTPVPQQCPNGQIFSKELLQCVVGDESDC